MAAFSKGDKVAWHQEFSSQHAVGSIIRADAVPDDAKVGEVKAIANEEGTYFEVAFEGHKNNLVLTEDELVKVSDA
jgi:hypothetical protein